MMRTLLTQNAATTHTTRPVNSVEFLVSTEIITAEEVAPDMRDLASRVRSLIALHQGRSAQVPLGKHTFDLVVTASGPEAHAVASLMDQVQHLHGHHPEACGPVIEDAERNRLFWLVPPGTRENWGWHPYGTCLSSPYEIVLPARSQVKPPGPYWLRPRRNGRFVTPGALADLLDRFQPGPVAHEDLLIAR